MRVTTRQIEFTINRTESVTIRHAARRTAWCGSCQSTVQMLSADEAAALTRTDPRNIFRMIESGQIHFAETDAGQLLLCAESLSTEESKEQ